MRNHSTTTKITGFVAVLIVFVLVFSQFVGQASAQGPLPPTKEKVQIAAVNLDEVQNYYGRLSDLQGNIGVVVEFKDIPAALVYAQRTPQASALAQNQVSLIRSQQTSFMNSLRGMGIKATELYRTQKVYNGIWLKVDSKDLAQIAAMPGVKAIHPMIPKTVDHTTSVPLVGAPQVWGGLAGILGENVTIGVIDTGIDYIHTNFGGNGVYIGQDFTKLTEPGNLFPTTKVVGGWDFAGDDYNADPNSQSYNPIPSPDPDPMDCNGHGSHVSGSAAGYGVLPDGSTYVESGADTYSNLEGLSASAYQSKFRIGPGVAPKASLYALRVFGCDGSTDLTEQAIEWAMDPNDDGNFSDHLDVINMSLGSNFGSEYDSSAVASNNAAQAGIIVVTSSGNSGDVYYITGAPGMARYAISTAASVDSGAVVSAFEATAPAALVGTHPAVEASFGTDPGTPGVTANVATTTPANGCTTIAEDLTGKIALIDRGTCNFTVKVKNAQLAGAIGAIIANNAVGFPISMGGTDNTITIPSMMTTQAVGNAIKAQLAISATVTVRLTSQYKDQFLMTDSAVEDTVASFSSRGPARGGTLLKPDITAPGDSIYSTEALSGNKGVSFNGTSMASPHMAGIMALLREQHPAWSVAELKALAMNTATNNVYAGLSHTGNLYSPTRVGAGRASVANAVQSDVIAYYKNDPGQVSVAFGAVDVVTTQTFTKSITVSNKSALAKSYNVGFDSRYQANAGLVFTLLDGNGAVLSNPVTVPANGTLEIKVRATVNPANLIRAFDPTVVTGSRQRFSEGGGYVTLTSTGSEPSLRVPVHIAARPAAAMSVLETGINLPDAASGTFDLTLSGVPVDTADDASMAYILEYMGEDANETSSTGGSDSADVQYVGAMSDYGFYPTTPTLFFGVSTYSRWDTSQSVEFDIYVDTNEDGTDDYVIFNTTQGFFTGTTDDVMFTAYCDLATSDCNADYYVNQLSGTYNTNLFNNNVMVLPVDAASLGLDGTNSDFDFTIYTFSRDGSGVVDSTATYHYDYQAESFSPLDPIHTGEPYWLDIQGAQPTFTIGYDKANIAANGSKGLLFLRTHNAANSAQVLLLPPTVLYISRDNPNPTNAQTVAFQVKFNTPVTGVDAADFFVESTGLSGASIVSVGGDTDKYIVTVDTGLGDGTLGLHLADNDSIKDADGNRLGGIGVGNGDFTSETYNVLKSVTFADVPGTYWAWSYIQRLYDNGITGGCGTSPLVFCPEGNVTRAQMAIFLLRAEHGPSYNPPPASGTVFNDVGASDFAAAWIEQLYAEGITGGCGGGNYCPNSIITRAQMAIFLLRGVHGSTYTPPTASGTMFNDVPSSAFAADWIEQLATEGITAGCGGGNFCPNATVSRAQMAVFLVKAFSLP